MPPPSSALTYRVFLIGDAGAPSLEATKPLLRLLQSQLDDVGQNSAIVFLGDNVYCCGLPDSADASRPRAELRLLEQLKAVKDFKGRIFFIPGNHDWGHSRHSGPNVLNREEAFIEAYLNRGDVFLPSHGFPGPVEVDLNDHVTLVILDTEWWLREEDRPLGDAGAYDLEEDGDFLVQLDDIVKRNRKKDLLVVGHHPVFSNGVHAGLYPAKTHLFPLAAVVRNAYVPLPIIGSLGPLYVRYFGGRQDLAHRRYQYLRRALLRIFAVHESLIYAAGHDHSLQYFKYRAPGSSFYQQYIVSGAGSRPTYVARGRSAGFTASTTGYVTLGYFQDGSIWMEMWRPQGDGSTGSVLFRHRIKGPSREPFDPEVPAVVGGDYPDYGDSTLVTAANPGYAAGSLKTFFLGSDHRNLWATPVTVPLLDMGKVAGGLTPIKRGGGMQTRSLRLRGGDGKEYVLRSIDKDPTASIPEALRGTVAVDIAKDQTASINPYGALIIPRLAEGAGIYHTHPTLVYVPDDPRLGRYRETFARQVMMLEVRPDDDMSDAPNFGHSKQVVSASTFYRHINDDNDDQVDQRAFARARLFDMLLADWDRHRQQWRWAAFEPAGGKGKIYRPIPRDRDWAFNRMNGVFPTLVKTFFDPKFQDFDYRYGYIKSLMKNGLEQDRRLTAGLSRSAWIEIADSLQQRLNDTVIDQAVRKWPDPIFALQGEDVIDMLKTRRDKLVEAAEDYYRVLAKDVDIVGSTKHERFEVTRLGDDSTRVVVYKTSKEGKLRKALYRRTFLRRETDEIRLFGLDGNDQFVVSGEGRRGILVRAIGGTGMDRFVDHSRVDGLSKKTHFYDTNDGNTWKTGPETRVTRSDDPAVNDYDPAYAYNVNVPQVFFGSNSEDGLFLGGGLKLIRHGFRKVPYAQTHRFVGNVAARTRAFNLVYEGDYRRVFGSWDVGLEAHVRAPGNIRNFYGLGNETDNTVKDAAFYQARLSEVTLASSLHWRGASGTTVSLSPRLEYTDVRIDEGRFLATQPGISPGSFSDEWFAGLDAAVDLDLTDNRLNPKQGFRWENGAGLRVGVRNTDDTSSRLASNLSIYLSPSLSPQITLAARVGMAHNIGEFPFYSANTLGQHNNLRGWRSTRFAGRTHFYSNAELRVALLCFSTYLANGHLGVLGFFDNGRVWTDGEQSRRWHQGYGGGLWVSLFDHVVVTGSLGASPEGRHFILRFGFLY